MMDNLDAVQVALGLSWLLLTTMFAWLAPWSRRKRIDPA